MGKKTLTNAHCLLDLVEKAPVSVLKVFSGLAESQALARGFDWSQDEEALRPGLLEHIKHLKSAQRDPAEREALRVLRLASRRGAAILSAVAQQLNDADLLDTFAAQDGGEIGRAVWMRSHSDETLRLFDVAESILNTGDIRGNKRLYDAFDVPCEDAPPFIWNDAVKKELETRLGELEIDGHSVALYFAARMSNERQYARVDTALRLRPRPAPGIVLTTATIPFPYAGTNVVMPIEDVLASQGEATAIDLARLKVNYRHGHLAALGGTAVSLKVSADGYAAVLSIPGKAPWKVTGKGKIAVLQRLVEAYAAGTPHVNTKMLMADTNCTSPANLFSKTSPWRNYLVKVKGAHAWQLNLVALEEPIEEVDEPAETAELAESA